MTIAPALHKLPLISASELLIHLILLQSNEITPYFRDATVRVTLVIARLPIREGMLANLFSHTEAPLWKAQWMSPAEPEVVCCWEQGLTEYIEKVFLFLFSLFVFLQNLKLGNNQSCTEKKWKKWSRKQNTWNKDLPLMFNPKPKTIVTGGLYMGGRVTLWGLCEAMSFNPITSQRHEGLWDKRVLLKTTKVSCIQKKVWHRWQCPWGFEQSSPGRDDQGLLEQVEDALPWNSSLGGFCSWAQPFFHTAVRILLKLQSDCHLHPVSDSPHLSTILSPSSMPIIFSDSSSLPTRWHKAIPSPTPLCIILGTVSLGWT